GCNPAYSKSIHTWLRFGEIMRGSLSAGYALFLAVIFFFGFKYNHDPEKITHRSVTH
ncbi:hypothetical protein, partial [Escherichia coli]|uniref:hypothetical protein n=1 Tax=Escherichia coli TaxID=562 RepID=UPI0012FF67AB